MISGRYLPEIGLMALKKAAEENVIDASLGSWAGGPKAVGHGQMDDLIRTGGANTPEFKKISGARGNL